MLSEDIKKLLLFQDEREKELKEDALKPKVDLKTTVGLFAFVYEKARNFVDYQEEHLLLRRAITRILIRRIKTENDPKELIESLMTELLMARYLVSGSISEEKIPQMERILSKYFFLYQNLGKRKLEDGENFLDFILSLCAREIEEIIAPSSEDQLVNFALLKLEKRTVWQNGGDEEEKRARLLVGLMRTLAKYEDRTIYYKLWKLYFPFWTDAGEEKILKVVKQFDEADAAIKKYLTESSGEPLARILKKHIAPFQILRDLLSRGSVEIKETFSSPEKLAKAAFNAANSRYRRALSSLRRSAVNSFVYIFITKMLFAFAIEIPYETLFAQSINYLPIFINLLFPPAFMLFMALTVESPTEENTRRIVDEILSFTFGSNGSQVIKVDLSSKRSALASNLFRFLYFLTFLLAFGGTLYVLRRLHFSIVSLGIFYFFISTISFFAFRIRSSFKELVVGEEGSNVVSTIFEFFMLPFIKLGRAISSGLQGMNIFIFIFDIVIEAPFKMILEVIEEWIRFLRDKKEEALNIIK